MGTLVGLGSTFNIVGWPSGIPIRIRQGEAITFLAYHAAGSQIITIEESIAGASKQTLAALETLYKGPNASGGPWTKIEQTASATYDNDDDATNDVVVFTIRADQLSPGYDSVEMTSVPFTQTHAWIHGLDRPTIPENLPSTIA